MPWAWRWPKSCWPPSSTATARDRRPPHLRVPGRRLPDGRHQPRSRRLAGAWKLNKLIALYDDNGISIDGKVTPWFIDNTPERFEAYGWNVIRAVDGHDVDAVDAAIAGQEERRQAHADLLQDHIGKGSPNRQDTAKAHGEPLGAEEIALTRAALGWTYGPFEIPADVYADWDAKAGAKAEAAWNKKFAAYAGLPRAGRRVHAPHGRRPARQLRRSGRQIASDAHDAGATVASRKASQLALEGLTAALPELLGGSADLTGSNLTNTKSTPAFRVDDKGAVVKTEEGQIGRHINYGVREFGMAAIMNGVALHGGFIPYGGTFLTFSDYSRNAIRMAALMKQRVIHVFTHDSIGLGEDGPTHQSIEHAASLRLIPGLDVWRPADTTETAVAWAVALSQKNRPQPAAVAPEPGLRAQERRRAGRHRRGAYVLSEPKDVGLKGKKAQAVIIATGSEVQLALAAQKQLAEKKIAVRVVSMPSTTTFDRQDVVQEGRAARRPAAHRRGNGRDRLLVEVRLRRRGRHRQLRRIGSRAVLFKHFGFTAENVADTVREALRRK
jgi:transketolase